MNNQTIIPLVDLQRGWNIWALPQIYSGDDGTGRIVPNVGDLVYDSRIPAMLEVVEVVNNFSRLSNPLEIGRTGVSSAEGLIGTGGGHVSETYRLNVDTKSDIPECSFDSRLRTYDSSATHLKIFVGVDTSVNGEVISAYYNNSGQYVSENIPYGPAFSGADGNTIKVPLTGKLTRPLGRGEMVTAVTYKDGEPRSECRLITRNTTNIRPYNGVNRIVDSISLKSIWLSPDEENTLIVPVNVPTGDIQAKCVVTYLDGGQREYSIDGVRAALSGMSEFASNSPGERKPLTLSYYPTDGEEVLGAGSGIVRHKSVQAWLRSREADGAYSVKLFACPEWMGEANGYKMRYYLLNLDGDLSIDVTRYVYSSDGNQFKPHGYGVSQTLTVKLDVGAATALGNTYLHIQQFVVTLITIPSESSSPWKIDYMGGTEFGSSVSAKLSFTGTNRGQLNLRSGALSQDEWLNKLYYSTSPLLSKSDGTLARRPTHVDIIVGDYVERHPISLWNKEMLLDNRVIAKSGDTAMIRFILETPTLDISLAVISVNMKM